ncbi:MAG: NPCBM/NEW2 domain-containing protein [Planctomycetota bacterium]|jgi:hypothetical protein
MQTVGIAGERVLFCEYTMALRLTTFLVFSALTGLTAFTAPDVQVTRVGKPEQKGSLESIDDEGNLKVRTATGVEQIPLAEIVEVLFKSGEFHPDADRAQLRLHVGDRLSGTLLGGTDDGGGVVFEDSVLGRLTFEDFGAIRWILFPPVKTFPEPPKEKRGSDMVFRGEEGSISGSLESLGKKELKLERPDLKMTIAIPYGDVRAVYISPLWKPEVTSELLAVLTLSNGDILTGRMRGLGGENVELILLNGLKIHIPIETLVSIGVRNGNFEFISDLEPSRITENPWAFDPPVTHEPPFENKVIYNYRKDRSYTGDPLKLLGRTYLKGIGTHSWTEIEYELDGEYKSFESRIGIDDSAGKGKGSVVFKVLLDGKEVYKSPVMVGGGKPIDVRVDVGGGKSLVLLVDFTHELLTPENGKPGGREEDHVLDRANWVGARLVKK